jgi:uncharacterized protein
MSTMSTPATAMDLLLAGASVALAVALLAAIAVLGIAAYSAHTVVRPSRRWQPADWQAPDPAPETVSFANAVGQRLHGWLVPPRSGGAVVLVCHGFGTNRREGQDLLPWLSAAGYGALLFDFQAHGESEGSATTVGLREVEDVLAAVDYVKQRFGPDTPIAGLGFSMGASVLIMAAARTADLRALVLDSPFATLRRAVARSFRVFFRLPPRVFTRPTIWWAERFTGGRIGDVQPILSVAALGPRPVLIIQGTDDGIVDPEDSLLLYEAAGEPKALWRPEGVGHVGARSAFPEEYRRRVLECLERVAPAAPAVPAAPAAPAGAGIPAAPECARTPELVPPLSGTERGRG